MRDKNMERWSSYEPFHIELAGKRIADIVITHHAKMRWADRVENKKTGFDDICEFLWEKLKSSKIESYYRKEQDVYLIEEDLVMVCEFALMDGETDIAGNPLYKMIVVTFLGRMSETMELRDLKSYYSWLRHSRRMTLIKNSRKRK